MRLTWSEIFALANVVVSAIGIVANVGLAIFLARAIQKKLGDQRVLKDIFIKEVLELRRDYKDIVKRIGATKVTARDAMRELKNINLKVNGLAGQLAATYTIDSKPLLDFHIELLRCITDADEFQARFLRNQEIFKEPKSINEMDRVFEGNQTIFVDIVMNVNNA